MDYKLIAQVCLHVNYPIIVMLHWFYTLLYRSTCGNNCCPFYLVTESSCLLRLVYTVTGRHTSTSNRNLMKFGYVESQKPTRDELSWVIGAAEAGFHINYVAVYYDIHKTIAYRINNRFGQRKLAGDRPKSGRQKKLTPQGERFTQITSRRERFITAILLCITSRNCLWYASIRQNSPEPTQMHVEDDQNIDILSFWKHFMTGTAFHTNEILQRCMKYLVLNEIVIALTGKNSVLISTWISVINTSIWNVLINFFVSVYIEIVIHIWKHVWISAEYPLIYMRSLIDFYAFMIKKSNLRLW